MIVGTISVAKSASGVEVRAHVQHEREDRGTRRSRRRADRRWCTFVPTERREQDREHARPAPAPCRPASPCSPCTAAATAAAARRCRRTRRRPATSRASSVQKLRRANSRRSTTGCASVSSQTTNSAKPTTATTASDRRSACEREPVEVLALVEHDLQRADPQHEQAEADAVDRQLARRRLARAVDHPRDAGGGEAHRHVDVEDPRPRDVVGDPAAEQRADDRRDQRRDRPTSPARVPRLGLRDSSTAAATATAGSSARRPRPAARGTRSAASSVGASAHSNDAMHEQQRREAMNSRTCP